ncbi:HAMP domain-containing sensor histidine kinase [Nonomuraea sp. NPDC049758]|uniref:sensor histidine kinase n=1 Tax=Nonomuraea sp. NPDC049758 TaxID=3154360 RepID=UPI00341BECCC
MNKLTIRARLTLVYAAFFLVGGVVLLGVTTLLVSQQVPSAVSGKHILSSTPSGPPMDEGRQMLSERIRTATTTSLISQGAIGLLLVGAASVGFGWLVAGRALQPLHRVTETARRLAVGAGRGLHERIVMNGPQDEVRDLADAFNLMVEQLDAAFDGQRRLVANASHELRTPLAMNRTLVELAVSRPGASEDCIQLGTSLQTVNERHERLIDGLLTLADSEHGITERTPVDLADIAGHVCDQRGVPCDGAAAAVTRGDPILLERLVQNLVENAVEHNVPSGLVSVTTRTIGEDAVLTVANSGPVVPHYEIESLFQPFRRLNRERTGGGRGFGLGLSIVRSIARGHGGSVTAVPRHGGGLVVTVRLPGPGTASPREAV